MGNASPGPAGEFLCAFDGNAGTLEVNSFAWHVTVMSTRYDGYSNVRSLVPCFSRVSLEGFGVNY